jgi:large subunit ribosomal protein L13
MKDTFIPSQNSITKIWYLIDAENKTLGRLASKISKILIGKEKSTYTPYISTGDSIIVINAEKINLSANKDKQKIYRNHSGRPGGMHITTFINMKKKCPEKIIFNAVKGMLPKSRFGRLIFNNLKVYKKNSHPHKAQKPKLLIL